MHPKDPSTFAFIARLELSVALLELDSIQAVARGIRRGPDGKLRWVRIPPSGHQERQLGLLAHEALKRASGRVGSANLFHVRKAYRDLIENVLERMPMVRWGEA